MLEELLKRPAAIARRRAGVLGPHLDSFLVAEGRWGTQLFFGSPA